MKRLQIKRYKDVCGNCKKDLKRNDSFRTHVESVYEEEDKKGCFEMAKEKVEKKEK